MAQRGNRLAGLLFAVLATWLSACAPGPEALGTAVAASAQSFQGLPVRADIAFWLEQGSAMHGTPITYERDRAIDFPGSASLRPLELLFWQARSQRYPAAIYEPPLPADEGFKSGRLSADPEDNSNPERVRTAMALLHEVSRCRSGDLMPLARAAPDYGYVATHQLLAVMFAQQRDCITERLARQLALPLLARLVSEVEEWGGTLTDVQVERAAILAMTGHADRIPSSLLRALVREQRDDGFWSFKPPEAENRSTILHNSVLAYVALSGAWALKQSEVTEGASQPALPDNQ